MIEANHFETVHLLNLRITCIFDFLMCHSVYTAAVTHMPRSGWHSVQCCMC